MALQRRSKFGIAVGVIVVLAAGVATAFLVVLGGHKAAANETKAGAAGFTLAQQLRLEHGLTAPSIAAEAGILAVELRARFVSRGKTLLPAGSHLRVNRVSFRAVSPRLGVVSAVVSGPAPGRWQLVLIQETGRWLLLGTRKLP